MPACKTLNSFSPFKSRKTELCSAARLRIWDSNCDSRTGVIPSPSRSTKAALSVARMREEGLVEMRNQRGAAAVQLVWILAGLIVIAAAVWGIVDHAKHSSAVQFSTPYQAVLLMNGAVYFGHLQGYGQPNPVLTDVFYIVSQTNPETKQVNNILVKRGKELHEPDRMYINASHIVFVEPVGPNSKVAQLIAQAEH
jgi:small nuclear ribonucleoprotein (snRNP)-like protein